MEEDLVSPTNVSQCKVCGFCFEKGENLRANISEQNNYIYLKRTTKKKFRVELYMFFFSIITEINCNLSKISPCNRDLKKYAN